MGGFFEWLGKQQLAEAKKYDGYTPDVTAIIEFFANASPEALRPGSDPRMITADAFQDDGYDTEAEVWRSRYPLTNRKECGLRYEIDGTQFPINTSIRVAEALEAARRNNTRIHISYGYTHEAPDNSKPVGYNWLEEHGMTGYVGRSWGKCQYPLLFTNRNTRQGNFILTDCIVRIRAAAGGRIIHQHPEYSHGKIEIRPIDPPMTVKGRRQPLTAEVLQDGVVYARFDTMAQAHRYVKRLGLV